MERRLSARRDRTPGPAGWWLAGALIAGVILVAGCSNESGSKADAGGRGGSSGSAGSAHGGSGTSGTSGTSGSGGTGGSATGGRLGSGGSNNSEGPILERPVRAEQDCTLTRPLEKLGLNPWSSGTLAETSAGAFLLWAQGSEFDTDEIPDEIALSTVDSAGTLGSKIPLAHDSGRVISHANLVSDSNGMAVLWDAQERNTAHFFFTKLDAEGAVTQPTTRIEGIEGHLDSAQIAARSGGYGVLYPEANSDRSRFAVHFAVLDAHGVLLGDPKTLEARASVGFPAVVLATNEGFIAAYPGTAGEGTAGEASFKISFLDETGNPVGAAIQFETNIYGYIGSPSLVVRGDELVVAFVAQTGSYDTSDIAETIHLAKFALSTHAPTVAEAELQARVIDVENVDPKLVALGDDLGLLWSQGSVIYSCAGCTPDNHLEFVVLDGEDFTPLSQRVVLENQELSGGYVAPQVLAVEDQLLVTSTLEYHVHGEGASASIQCTPRP